MTSPFAGGRWGSRGLAAYFDATELREEVPRRRRIAALMSRAWSLVFGPARNAFPQQQMGAPSASAVTPQRLGAEGHDREHECRSGSEIFIAVPTRPVASMPG